MTADDANNSEDSMPDPHPDELAFLAKIADHPDYPLPRLVFADWLEERDDRRAAWVRDDDLWEWMKPDAHDPIPGILAALPAPRYRSHLHPLSESATKAVAALRQLEPTTVDTVRDWLRANPNHWPAAEVQAFVAAHPPAKLRPVRELQQAIQSNEWSEVWLAANDLGFHGPAAAPAINALMARRHSDEWTAMSDAMESVDVPIENAIHRTLGKIGPAAQSVVPILAEHLWIYPESIEEALLGIGADAEVVVDNLNTDEDWEVIEGLGVAAQLTNDPVALFVRAAQRHTGRIARGSIYHLGELGPAAAAAIPALAELSQAQGRWDAESIRRYSLRALAQISGEAPPT